MKPIRVIYSVPGGTYETPSHKTIACTRCGSSEFDENAKCDMCRSLAGGIQSMREKNLVREKP